MSSNSTLNTAFENYADQHGVNLAELSRRSRLLIVFLRHGG